MPPPTPTAIPLVIDQYSSSLQMPDFGMWQYADDAVGLWNMFGAERTVALQWVIVLVIVLASTFFIVTTIRGLSSEHEE
jgi:hypothetical protein